MLHRLLQANDVELAGTDAGIQDLNDWFRANVEANPDVPGRLLPEWYWVVNDVALFLGDVMISRCPALRWEFFTAGKKNISFQRHVGGGFSRVPGPKYSVDLDHRVAIYAHRIIANRGSVASYRRVSVRGVEIDVDAAVRAQRGEVDGDAFLQWVQMAESYA